MISSTPLDAQVAGVLQDPAGNWWAAPLETLQISADAAPEIDGHRYARDFDPGLTAVDITNPDSELDAACRRNLR